MITEDRFEVALTKCYFCGEDDKILLNTRLTAHAAKQVRECHQKVVDMDPCPKCRDFMQKGVILIAIDSNKSDPGWNQRPEDSQGNWMPNPYRTGGFAVVRDAAIKRILPKDLADHALRHRFMFIEHEAAVKLGIFEG
jgi:hypothetical protein